MSIEDKMTLEEFHADVCGFTGESTHHWEDCILTHTVQDFIAAERERCAIENDQLKRDLAIALRRVADGPFMNRLERMREALEEIVDKPCSCFEHPLEMAIHSGSCHVAIAKDALKALNK